MEQSQYNSLFSFIWNIATDVLVYAFNKGEYKKIILLMLVLRRIDVLLEPTKEQVLQMKEQLDRNHIENQAPVLYNSSDYVLLEIIKQGVIIRDLSENKGKFPKEFNTYKIVEPNDIIFCLFNIDETPRTVGLSHNYGMITGAYDVFKIKDVNPKFILYYYLSIDDRKALRPLYKGLRKVVPLPTFMSSKIFLPPLSEQQTIVEYIDAKLSKIDQYMADLQAEIDYLKEFKQRLISDAVTGQICVTEPQKGDVQ